MVDKKKPQKSDYKSLFICHGEYGWEKGIYNTPSERASYLWQLATSFCSPEEAEKNVRAFERVLDKYHIHYEYEDGYFEGRDNWGQNCVDGYVDHSPSGQYIINKMQEHENLLLRFLYGEKSIVVTGNDNSYEFDDLMNKFGYMTYHPVDGTGDGWYELLEQTKDVEIFEKGN